MTAGFAVLVPGGHGQLGRELVATAPDGVRVTAPGRRELDITQPGAVLEAVTTLVAGAKAAGVPPIVLNAASFTAVDDAETEQAQAFAVNGDGPRVLAAVCASRDVPLVHVSTDYVFSGDVRGDAKHPYETDDKVGPKSVYGLTKLAGEDAVLGSGARAWVVRTAWLYGAAGYNFVKTMARLERERDTISVVDDQIGSPTWTRDFAAGVFELCAAVVAGNGPEQHVLHCTGAGEASRFAFARAIFTELGTDPERVRPVRTEDFPRPAERPAYSVLADASWRKAGLTPLRPWREALAEAFAEQGDAFTK
ncbi:dTDP-4-dehydrorhamnose reductase [Herbihabitans rhizosphaerae]|uniref:dTDP-4-dehydrorhamnose reductase n=1 Tax=Herbihabitans rhizosphaerae TaxID=1872711 RepID=A0A4Q7KGD1_9PSEU|nr:dTDP-4-dehydrorhamnose reductase [Herbihabitans rhizosphaerae]RZS33890.1 dTDP-4-dehydrorhamnose reductase [Herbihabitans rhizosphaerae]